MPEIARLKVVYEADTSDAEAGAERVNSTIGKLGKTAALVGAAAGVAVGGFLLNGIRAAANFEQGMSGVAASLGGVGVAGGITEAQFKALNDEALRIGQTTSVGATDAAMAMELLAKAGVSTETILDGTAQAVVNVSEATGESVAQSASSLGSLSNLFAATGISGSEMADVIVNAMNASDATLSEFQTGIANLAPVIAGTGMEFDDAAGLISFFNAQGMAAAKVGSSLTSAYMNLVNPTTAQAEAQAALGVAVYDSAGQFRGFPEILDDVRTATEGMTDQQRDAWITQLFGAEALDVVTMALESQEGALEDHVGAMNESGAAATAAATRMDNLKGDLEGLKGAFETLSIKVGNAFTPALRVATQALTGMLTGAMKFVEELKLMYDTGNVFTEQWIQKFPGWAQPVVRAIVGIHEAFQDVIDAFQDLRAGDIGGFFDELGEAARGAWDALSQLVSTTLNWAIHTAVPAITGWLVDHASDIWGGIKTIVGAVFDGIVATISWTANVGVPTIIGEITRIAGRAADWLKGYLIDGLSQVGDGTGGPDPTGSNGSLTALIDAWSIRVGVPRVVGAITSIAGRLGDWLRGYIYGGSLSNIPVLGNAAAGAAGGITVEIAQIIIDVLDAVANIQASDIQGWIQDRVDEIGTVKAEIKEWQIIIGDDPDVQGDPRGRSESSLRKALFEGLLMVTGLRWSIEVIKNPDIIGDPLYAANNHLQTLARGWRILVNDLAWKIAMAIPDVGMPSLADLVAAVKGKIPDIAIPSIDWSISLNIPDFNIPSASAVLAALREAAEDAGFPDWLLDRIPKLGGAESTPAMDWGKPFGTPPGNLGQASEFAGTGATQGITTLPNVGAGPQGVLNQVQGIGQQIAQAMAQAMAQIANAVRAGAQQAIAALTPISTGFRAMATQVQAAAMQMAAMVRAQFAQMQAATMASVTALTTQVRAQFTQLQASTSAAMTAMVAQATAQFAQLTAQGTAQSNALRGAVQSAMQAMASAGSSAMAQFASAVQSGFQQAAAAAQSGVAAIRGAVNSIGSLYGQGYSIGASFGQGVAAGLYSMLGAVQAAASAIVAAAASAAAAAGRIASPSKLMRDEVGVPLAQGVIVGMDSQRSAVAQSFASLIPNGGIPGRTAIGSSAYAARGQAPVQQVTIITLEPGKWAEYLRKAENGNRAYQQQQPRSRELALGLGR